MSSSFFLHYEDRAAIIDRKRVPLVLIHAFPLGPEMWNDVVELLAGRNIVVDLPGFGNTPVPDGPPNLDDAADALAATLDEAKIDKAVIAGLSLGGYVALSFVERHRERVAGLALLDTNMGADSEDKRAERANQVAAVRESGSEVLSVDGILGETTKKTSPLVVANAEQLAREAHPDGVVWALEAMAARPERTYVAREAGVPILLLAGDEDTLSPIDVLRDPLIEVDDIEVVTVEGAGHLTAMEKPQEVAEALDDLVGRV